MTVCVAISCNLLGGYQSFTEVQLSTLKMEAKYLSETSVTTNLCANHTMDNILKRVWRLVSLYLVTYSMWFYRKTS